MQQILDISLEFSKISNLECHRIEDSSVFIIDDNTQLHIEKSDDDSLLASLCYFTEDDPISKEVFIEIQKRFHPFKNPDFFCKTLLLNECVIVIMRSSINKFNHVNLNKFIKFATETLSEAGVNQLWSL